MVFHLILYTNSKACVFLLKNGPLLQWFTPMEPSLDMGPSFRNHINSSPTLPLRYYPNDNYSINLYMTPSSKTLQFFLFLFLGYYLYFVTHWDEVICLGFPGRIKALTGLSHL